MSEFKSSNPEEIKKRMNQIMNAGNKEFKSSDPEEIKQRMNYIINSKETKSPKTQITPVETLPTASSGGIRNLPTGSKEYKPATTIGGKFLSDVGNIGSNLVKSAESGLLQFGKTLTMRMDERFNRENELFNKTDSRIAEMLDKKGKTEQAEKIRQNIIANRVDIDNTQNYQDKINKLNQEMILNTANTSNNVTQKIAGLSQSIGNNLVGMGVSALNPALGATYFTGSAYGSYYDEGIERGMNEEQAKKYATPMAIFEGLTEKALAGENIKGFKAILEGAGWKNALKSFGIEVGENFLQEAVMPGLSELTTKTLVGDKYLKNDYRTKEGWLNLAKDSLSDGIDGALSAILLNGSTKMVGSCINVVNKVQQGQSVTPQEIQTAVRDAQNVGVDTQGILQNEVAKVAKNKVEQSNLKAEELPVANKKYDLTNKYREQAIEMIQNSKIPDEIKKESIAMYQNAETLTQQDIDAVANGISEVERVLQERQAEQNKIDADKKKRQDYMKYKNDTKEYDSSVVNEVNNVYPTNRNGKRTVKQWLTMAEDIGSRISNKTDAEIERIAYKSWFDLEPSKSITRYDNVNKTNVAFQKLSADEWTKAIIDSANKNRQTQEVLPVANENQRFSVPQEENTLQSTAQKFKDRFESEDTMNRIVSSIEKIVQTRNESDSKGKLNVLFDDTIQGNGVIEIDNDGNRTIKLNPNSKKAVEFTLVHELSHDLKGTDGYNQLVDLVKQYNQGNANYESAFNDIKAVYEDHYRRNNLDISKLDINEEAMNDILGTALGTQEFVNRLAGNRTLFQKIYDWVKRQIKTNFGQNKELARWLYQVQDNFENALKQKNELQEGIKKSIQYHDVVNINDRIIDRTTGKEYTANDDIIPYIAVDEEKLKYIIYTQLEEFYKNDVNTMDAIASLCSNEATKQFTNGEKNGRILYDSKIYSFEVTNNNEFKITKIETLKNGGIVDERYSLPDNRYTERNELRQGQSENNSSLLEGQRTGKQILNMDRTKQKQTNELYEINRKSGNNLENSNQGSFSMQENKKYSVSDDQETRLSKLNSEFDLYDKTREDLYDRRDAVKKEYDSLVNSEEYKEAVKRAVKMDTKTVQQSEEYKLMKQAQDLKNRINDYQDEIDIASKEMNRLANEIDNEEKGHRDYNKSLKEAKNALGLTNDFREAGYMLEDGTLLDFTGRSQGSGVSGKRTMDHREINEFGYEMNEFIDAGNIRLQPESNGFELMHEPTAKQYSMLRKYIENANGEVFIDIYKNSTMGQYDSATYKAGTSASKVISDLQYYFQNGKFPAKSMLVDFLYSQTKKGKWNDYLNELDQNLAPVADRKKTYYNELKTGKYTEQQQNKKATELATTPGEEIDWTTIENPGDKKFRKHYLSIIQSDNTTAQAKAISKKLMKQDTYVPDSNTKQIERADKVIAISGANDALTTLSSNVMNGKPVTPTDIAVGERLIEYYSKVGDAQRLAETIRTTAMAGTSAGQAVQAMRILNRMTPQGQAVWVEKCVEKLNNDLQKQRGKNAPQFDLKPEMLEKIVNSKNDTELKNNLDEVYRELGQQVSKSTIEQLDSWRHFSMLGNARTHIRNITGNFLMGITQDVKNKLAGAIEDVFLSEDAERTRTFKSASPEVKEFAKNDLKNVTEQLSGSKYTPQNMLRENMRTFKSDAMENTLGRLFKWNDNLLEAEDGWGLKSGYVKALANYITANNLDINNMTDKQLSKARNYAVQQAQERTFHQANEVASALNTFFGKNKVTKAIGDATLPFVKTPANVAKTGIEYSPAGLAKSLIMDSVKLRKGNININQYIDNITKGLTGTGITILGITLAQAGILKASGGDDDKKEKFDEQNGKQAYSIQIGDKTYSLDWLSPVGIPLMVGAEIYQNLTEETRGKQVKSNDETKEVWDKIEAVGNSLAGTLDPMTEMSMISGLTSALRSYNTNQTGFISEIVTNGVKSYINQYFPTFLGQVAKAGDTVERDTTTTKTGTLAKAYDSTLNQIKSKVPGLRQTLPTRKDIWGEDIKLADTATERFIQAGIIPATIKNVNNSKVVQELDKLYEANGETGILPSASLDKQFTINKEKYRMTNEEYNESKTQYGKTSYKLIDELIKSKEYKNMSNHEKETAIKNIYTYAKEQNKVNYAKDNNIDYEESKLFQATTKLNSLDKIDCFDYKSKIEGMTKTSEKIEALSKANYSKEAKTVIYENLVKEKDDAKYDIIKETGLDIDKYLEYKLANLNGEFKGDKEDDGTVKGKTVSKNSKRKR